MMLCIAETGQITVSRIEILVVALIRDIKVVAPNGCFGMRFCQQFRQTRIEILTVYLNSKDRDKLIAYPFILHFYQSYNSHKSYLQASQAHLVLIYQTVFPGSIYSFRKKYFQILRSYLAF